MENQLLVVDLNTNQATVKLQNANPQSLALDPFRRGRIYAATFGNGLRLSEDFGSSWNRVGEDSLPAETTSVAVSSTEQNDGLGTVFVGTEPSAIFRSDDGGETWTSPGDILKLASSSSWSFPPKPDTHHVRYIAADPVKPGLVYAAIEAGALIRSFDGGVNWKDRVRGAPYDTHTLATTPTAPGRVYSAAGDGYFESTDYGESWHSEDNGLRHHYLYSVSVHPKNPDNVLVSAAEGPWTAYDPDNAESYVYRKNGGGWKRVKLPGDEQSTVSVFAPDSKVDEEFYAANSLGIHRSSDGGAAWEKLPVSWPESFRQNVWSLALMDG
jgi:photosystem II stability/assembly factor-like uncharacterized protein